METKKVAIAACTGLDQPLGTIARQSAYQILDLLRPDDTILLCTPALTAEVEEDVVFAKENPILVIDGCKQRCCEKIVRRFHGRINTVLQVDELQAKYKLPPITSHQYTDSIAQQLIEIVAKEGVAVVDRITKQERAPL